MATMATPFFLLYILFPRWRPARTRAKEKTEWPQWPEWPEFFNKYIIIIILYSYLIEVGNVWPLLNPIWPLLNPIWPLLNPVWPPHSRENCQFLTLLLPSLTPETAKNGLVHGTF